MGLGQAPAHGLVLHLACAPGDLDEALEGVVDAGHVLHPEAAPLVCERAHRDAPAVVEDTDQVVLGDERVGEEDLGEMGGARDLAQGSDLDAGRVHVDDQDADALVLGDLGVGAHVAEALLGPHGV